MKINITVPTNFICESVACKERERKGKGGRRKRKERERRKTLLNRQANHRCKENTKPPPPSLILKVKERLQDGGVSMFT